MSNINKAVEKFMEIEKSAIADSKEDEKLTVVKKEIKDMTEKEILRQQLELLAEISVTNGPAIQ